MFAFVISVLLLQDPSPDPVTRQPVGKKREKKIVATRSRHDADVLDVPSSVTVITEEEIRDSNARTVVDVMQARPGIFVSANSSTPQDSVVDVRGFNNGGG